MYNCTVYVAVFGALAVTTHFQCGDNLQNCSFPWGSGPPPNAGFLGPTRVHNPDGISTGSAGFVGLTLVSSRETYRRHRPRHIDSNRPHLMLCIAMWPGLIMSTKSCFTGYERKLEAWRALRGRCCDAGHVLCIIGQLQDDTCQSSRSSLVGQR